MYSVRFDTTFAGTMVMCRGLVGASHRIVIRYPIRRRVCTARRTATGACRMAAARSSARAGGATRRSHKHQTPLSPPGQTEMPHDDAFRFRELIVAMKHEFTRFASRVRAETTEQIHTWHCIEPSKLRFY